MVRLLGVFVALSFGMTVAVRDVPLGECHGCEVTCFEDCSLKYDREILQMEDFLQVKDDAKNQTESVKDQSQGLKKLSSQYSQCLKDDKCPCKKEEAAAAMKNKTSFLQKNTTSCAVGEAPCAQKCSQKVVTNAHANLEKKAAPKDARALLQKRDYPIHSVTVGVFTKGAMTLDQCLKFCLAATCGCDKAPGLDTIDKLFNAIKQNDAAVPGEKDFSHRGAVVDTHKSEQFAPAKIEECAKGMIGKKVSKGLYVDFGGGVGGEIEVCSKKFMEKVFGPGDHKKKEQLCASTKSDDMKWGCIWNEEKSFCMVGFSPNLRCQKKFFDDPSDL